MSEKRNKKEELSDYFKSLRLDRDVEPAVTPRDSSINDEYFKEITTQATSLQHSPVRARVGGATAGAQVATHHDERNSTYPGRSSLTLLPPPSSEHRAKNLLVLDLDETLVHSSSSRTSHNPNSAHDVKLPLILQDGQRCEVFVKLRPFVYEFLQTVGKIFEVVIFTASLSRYATPLISVLDPEGKNCHHRLYREHCTEYAGSYVKDLTLLGRPLNKIVIIDNSPAAYLYQPRNAIPCTTWVGDPLDTELQQFLPFLTLLAVADDVYPILDAYHELLQQHEAD